MLELKNLCKSYGRHIALSNLSLTIPDGALYGLVGPNGAGKTTAIKLISGIMLPDRGEILFDNVNLVKEERSAKETVGYVPDVLGIYDDMTVFEYMVFFASTYGLTGYIARKKIEILLEQVGMTDKKDFYLNELSRGMQQKLALIISLMLSPKLLLLDEPTLGLDIKSKNSVIDNLNRLVKEKGMAVILTTHQMEVVQKLNGRVLILKDGVVKNFSENIEDKSLSYIVSYIKDGKMVEEEAEGEFSEVYDSFANEEIVEIVKKKKDMEEKVMEALDESD